MDISCSISFRRVELEWKSVLPLWELKYACESKTWWLFMFSNRSHIYELRPDELDTADIAGNKTPMDESTVHKYSGIPASTSIYNEVHFQSFPEFLSKKRMNRASISMEALIMLILACVVLMFLLTFFNNILDWMNQVFGTNIPGFDFGINSSI